jgi:hypothetical protein
LSETGTYTIDPGNSNKNGDEEKLRTEAIDYIFGVNQTEDKTLLNDETFVSNSFDTNITGSTSTNDSFSSETSPASKQHEKSDDSQKKRQLIKYSNRIKKTLTYDVIRDSDNSLNMQANGHDDDEDQAYIDDNATTIGQLSLCTDMLLGDTNDLMRKINQKKTTINRIELDALSSRAVVNNSDEPKTPPNQYSHGDEDDEYDDDVTTNNLNDKSLRSETGGLAFDVDFNDLNQRLYELKRDRSKIQSVLTTTRSSFDAATPTTMNSQKTKSLGTKIQEKAQKNMKLENEDDKFRRLSTPSPQHSPQMTSGTNTNRALYLRQQSALAKRDAFNNNSNPASSPSSSKKQPILKSSFKDSISSAPSTSRLTKTNSARLPTSSRSQSPGVHTPPSYKSSPMSLNASNLHLAAAKDAFQKRKNYDPMKSLNDEKLKKQQKPTNGDYKKQLNDFDSVNQDLCTSIQNLRHNISNTNQVYRLEFSFDFLCGLNVFCAFFLK